MMGDRTSTLEASQALDLQDADLEQINGGILTGLPQTAGRNGRDLVFGLITGDGSVHPGGVNFTMGDGSVRNTNAYIGVMRTTFTF